MTTKSSLALHMAHILHKSKPSFAWADIVRHAWYFVRFREWLKDGLVTFTYLKKDNSIRDARGTLCEYLIPQEDLPKGCQRSAVSYQIINYFDIDRKAWRSFDIRLFVGYVERFPLQKEKVTKEKTMQLN